MKARKAGSRGADPVPARNRKPSEGGKAAAETDRRRLAEAAELSLEGMRKGQGGPFGALVALGGKVVGRGWNRVIESGDPTAHAEVTAIREACRSLGTFHLEGAVLYTSCEPCPMCLGAAYWARVARIVYANTRAEAEAIGFSDAFIYRELDRAPGRRKLPMVRLRDATARRAFAEWLAKADKVPY